MDQSLLKKMLSSLVIRGFLIVSTIFVFPPFLLAPFAALSQYLTINDLMAILTYPITYIVIAIHMTLAFFCFPMDGLKHFEKERGRYC
jgi:hypothetical protein